MNRILRNKIKSKINELKEEKEKIQHKLNEYYKEKKLLELDNKSDYYILTTLNLKSIDEIKEIYKKRWEVETHFRFCKKIFKFDSMYIVLKISNETKI